MIAAQMAKVKAIVSGTTRMMSLNFMSQDLKSEIFDPRLMRLLILNDIHESHFGHSLCLKRAQVSLLLQDVIRGIVE